MKTWSELREIYCKAEGKINPGWYCKKCQHYKTFPKYKEEYKRKDFFNKNKSVVYWDVVFRSKNKNFTLIPHP